MNQTTRKYVPHLPSMQALCELNYSRFLRLLPDCDTESLVYRFSVAEQFTYQITIDEAARYTTTLTVSQNSTGTPEYLKPSMSVRLYHDARMAEVITSPNTGAFAPSYDYPNSKMRQRNEKLMINIFLAEWLQFCLKNKPVVSAPV